MGFLEVQQWLPLLSAGVWLGLTGYQLYRDRYRTWTEVYFLATTFFVGMYALSDFLFFMTPTGDFAWAERAALSSFSSLTLAVLFFMLFGVVFLTRFRNVHLLATLPVLILLPLLWGNLVEGWKSVHPDGRAPYVGDWDSSVYLLWSAYVVVYMTVGAVAFWRTYREVTRVTSRLRGRMRGIMIAVILSFALGASTNMISGLVRESSEVTQILPLFSTAVVIPGLVSFVALSPLGKERLSTAVRVWKSRQYDVKAVFLIFEDGTLIGAKVKPGERMVDKDLFGATLDVIQNFMQTSFPGLRGGLRAISHGDHTLVMERARKVYLTLVIGGRETDQLRRQMRDLLLGYEQTNRAALDDWRGLPDDAEGTEELIDAFLLGTDAGPDGGFARPEPDHPGVPAEPKH